MQALPWVTASTEMYTGADPVEREIFINRSRSALKESVRLLSPEYVVCMDSDVVMLRTNVIEDMLLALIGNKGSVALAVDTKGVKWSPQLVRASEHWGHKCCALCIMTFESYLLVEHIGSRCQCAAIASLGNIKILPGTFATEVAKLPAQALTKNA